jgi:hypothetical protein
MTVTLDTIASKLQQITDLLIASSSRLTIAPNQVVISSGLSDIDHRLGLIQAGEFRAGNGKQPGDGFTGGRFGYPGFIYGTDEYFLAGVQNDVLQVGLSIVDGKIFGGAGDVVIDSDGIWIKNQQAAFGFENTANARFQLYIFSDGFDDLVIKNKTGGAAIRFEMDTATHKVMRLDFREDPGVAEVPQLWIHNTDPGYLSVAAIILSTGVKLVSGVAGGETVFNDDSADVDFRVESDGNDKAILVDAATDRISFFGAPNAVTTLLTLDGGTDKRFEFGGDHYIPIRSSPNPNVYFNEANQDMDFIVETGNSDYGLYMDAGLDRATSFQWDGWANMTHHVWTRTGNFTFTIAGDVTAIYRKGAKVRYYNGSLKYGVIASSAYSSPNTTITLITNTDYLMGSAPDYGTQFISYIKNPEGFPAYFNWDAAPTNFTGTTVARWRPSMTGMLKFDIELTSTSTVAGTVTITLPVAHTRGTTTPFIGAGYFLDVGNASYPAQIIAISTTTARPVAFNASGTYATQSFMAAAVPFTWGNTDEAQFAGEYPY